MHACWITEQFYYFFSLGDVAEDARYVFRAGSKKVGCETFRVDAGEGLGVPSTSGEFLNDFLLAMHRLEKKAIGGGN